MCLLCVSPHYGMEGRKAPESLLFTRPAFISQVEEEHKLVEKISPTNHEGWISGPQELPFWGLKIWGSIKVNEQETEFYRSNPTLSPSPCSPLTPTWSPWREEVNTDSSFPAEDYVLLGTRGSKVTVTYRMDGQIFQFQVFHFCL